MESSDDKKQETFENDYNEIMKDFQNKNTPLTSNPQWTNPSDFLVKFSLYQETPNSITSTGTLVNLGI